MVVDARPLGDAEDGRQLVALKIKAGADGSIDPRARPAGDGFQPQAAPTNGAAASNQAAGSHVTANDTAAAKLPDRLSAAERADLAKLQQRDQQVRQEEKAHAAVAGDLAGPISYIYQRGPDGRQYAVGGSVNVQASTISGDPNEAKRLSGRMAAAAHAATSPSAQDLATARQAYDFGSQLADPASPMRRDPGLNLIF